MSVYSIIKTSTEAFKEIKDSGLLQTFLGSYSDGETRSIPDAISGEVFSPRQKKKAIKKGKKRKKIRIIDIL